MRKVGYTVLAILFLGGCQGRTTVKAEALETILPTRAEVNAFLLGSALSSQNDYICATFKKSPDFLEGREQEWFSKHKSTELKVIVAVFTTKDAAVRTREKWLSSVPWHAVETDPIGEMCRFEPQVGWQIEFFRANVYVKVGTRPGDEQLARAVARVIESKIEPLAGIEHRRTVEILLREDALQALHPADLRKRFSGFLACLKTGAFEQLKHFVSSNYPISADVHEGEWVDQAEILFVRRSDQCEPDGSISRSVVDVVLYFEAKKARSSSTGVTISTWVKEGDGKEWLSSSPGFGL